jgi:hypothetical protein
LSVQRDSVANEARQRDDRGGAADWAACPSLLTPGVDRFRPETGAGLAGSSRCHGSNASSFRF